MSDSFSSSEGLGKMVTDNPDFLATPVSVVYNISYAAYTINVVNSNQWGTGESECPKVSRYDICALHPILARCL